MSTATEEALFPKGSWKTTTSDTVFYIEPQRLIDYSFSVKLVIYTVISTREPLVSDDSTVSSDKHGRIIGGTPSGSMAELHDRRQTRGAREAWASGRGAPPLGWPIGARIIQAKKTGRQPNSRPRQWAEPLLPSPQPDGDKSPSTATPVLGRSRWQFVWPLAKSFRKYRRQEPARQRLLLSDTSARADAQSHRRSVGG